MTEAQGPTQPFPGSERFTKTQVLHLLNAIDRANTRFEGMVFKGMVSPGKPQLAIEDGDAESVEHLVRTTRGVVGRSVAFETTILLGKEILWEDIAQMLGDGSVPFEEIPSMILDHFEKPSRVPVPENS
jgi:hypothetical protein